MFMYIVKKIFLLLLLLVELLSCTVFIPILNVLYTKSKKLDRTAVYIFVVSGKTNCKH